jgi:hypothetical protein
MPNSTPRRSAHALPNRDCAPQGRKTKRERHLFSDARCRELHQKSQGLSPTAGETAQFVRLHQAFIGDIFNDPWPELDQEGAES